MKSFGVKLQSFESLTEVDSWREVGETKIIQNLHTSIIFKLIIPVHPLCREFIPVDQLRRLVTLASGKTKRCMIFQTRGLRSEKRSTRCISFADSAELAASVCVVDSRVEVVVVNLGDQFCRCVLTTILRTRGYETHCYTRGDTLSKEYI